MSVNGTVKAEQRIIGRIKAIPQVDRTLTKDGCFADAKVVGDRFAEQRLRIDNIDPHYARNVEYVSNELNATNVQDALDEMNSNNKNIGASELLASGELETTYNIDASKYRFIYYELRTSTGLCMISNLLPVSILTGEVQEFNHTEYATSSYNAEITVQIRLTSVKAYKKALAGWNLSHFNVYGIY